ncbi:MAG: hypothetical protein AAFR66_21425 [Bacteroidota bacterium]
MASLQTKLTSADVKTLLADRNSGLGNMMLMIVLFYVLMPALFLYVFKFTYADVGIYALVTGILLFAASRVIGKKYADCKKDLETGTKITGTYELIHKHKISLHGNSKCWFTLNMDGQKDLSVPSDVYYRLEEGDTIYIEMTEASRKLLKVEKVA